MMRLRLLPLLLLALACSSQNKTSEAQTIAQVPDNIIAVLDTIFYLEQEPIRLRDSLGEIYGVESAEAQEQQEIYRKNHIVNEKRIVDILDKHGWSGPEVIGERGGMILSNVLQHASEEVRIKYLPMQKKAVIEKKLEPRYLVRAEDRLATDRGDLQIYGGQMKFYPETKSFNVWPVYDPENIDKRRAEIGLGPIKEYLKGRFDFDWDLDEQLKRTAEFEKAKTDKN